VIEREEFKYDYVFDWTLHQLKRTQGTAVEGGQQATQPAVLPDQLDQMFIVYY